MRTLQFRELSTFCRMIGEFVVGKGRAGHNVGSHDEDSAQKRGAQSAQNCFAITNGVGLKRPLAKVSRPKFAPREHSGQRPPEIRARRSRLLKATRASKPTDTRKTLETFTWPPAIVSIVVSAYLSPGDRETSPARVTVGQRIDPKVPFLLAHCSAMSGPKTNQLIVTGALVV